MRTRAAVATAAGQPLEVMDIELQGPQAGEVLIEIKATGICHTDEFNLVGGQIRRDCFRPYLDMKVPVWWSIRDRGSHRSPRAITSFRCIRLNVGKCPSCLSRKTNLCTAIRGTQGQGLMPDGTSRFSTLDGDPILHYMGCSDLRAAHCAARDCGCQGARGRTVRQDLLYWLRRDDRPRCSDEHGQG